MASVVLLVVLSSALFLASQKQTTEVVNLETKLGDLALKTSDLGSELQNMKEFQTLILGTNNPPSNIDTRICARYWVDVKSTLCTNLDVSNGTVYEVNGSYILWVYTQYDNVTLELEYSAERAEGYSPNLYILEGTPYEYLNRVKDQPLLWSCSLQDTGFVRANLPTKGWYTLSLFGKEIMGGNNTYLTKPQLNDCEVKGELRLIKNGGEIPYGLGSYRLLNTVYNSEK
jgi:hypothetical protein